MCYGMIRPFIANVILAFLMVLPAYDVLAETNQEMETWTYHKDFDKLNNLNFSYARSPMPQRNLYDNIRLEIICKDTKLQLVAQTSSLITSQGSEFAFEYQVDKKPPVAIKLRTFKDNKRRGYSDAGIDRITAELLSGQTVFIRINTIISTVLSAEITLKEAASPIKQVLTDCGIPDLKTP